MDTVDTHVWGSLLLCPFSNIRGADALLGVIIYWATGSCPS